MMRLRNFSAAACPASQCFQNLAFVVDGAPQIAELAVDLHERLIQMPPPLRIGPHVSNPASFGFRQQTWGQTGSNQNRTVSWLMSIPRSAKRSSTLRSDSGYLTYIITTRRMTSGELLKYRNGLLIAQAYHGQGHGQHLV
jgi:hypothetical protein